MHFIFSRTIFQSLPYITDFKSKEIKILKKSFLKWTVKRIKLLYELSSQVPMRRELKHKAAFLETKNRQTNKFYKSPRFLSHFPSPNFYKCLKSNWPSIPIPSMNYIFIQRTQFIISGRRIEVKVWYSGRTDDIKRQVSCRLSWLIEVSSLIGYGSDNKDLVG